MGRRPKHLGPGPAGVVERIGDEPSQRIGDDVEERTTPPEPVPAYRVTPTWVIELSELWHGRLETLAKRDHVKPADYVEHLIRRAWVASGAGKGQP